MKRVFCSILLIIAGAALLTGDFDTYEVGLKIFAICLLIVTVLSLICKSDLPVTLCKILFFPLYLIWLVLTRPGKKPHRDQEDSNAQFWEDMYWSGDDEK